MTKRSRAPRADLSPAGKVSVAIPEPPSAISPTTGFYPRLGRAPQPFQSAESGTSRMNDGVVSV
jgi:hypothetical protein